MNLKMSPRRRPLPPLQFALLPYSHQLELNKPFNHTCFLLNPLIDLSLLQSCLYLISSIIIPVSYRGVRCTTMYSQHLPLLGNPCHCILPIPPAPTVYYQSTQTPDIP